MKELEYLEELCASSNIVLYWIHIEDTESTNINLKFVKEYGRKKYNCELTVSKERFLERFGDIFYLAEKYFENCEKLTT